MHLSGNLSWLSIFVHLWVYWRLFELKRTQFKWFEIVKCNCTQLRVRGHDLRLFECNWAHFRVLRSFEFKQTKFDVVECNYTHLRVLRSFESKRTWFEVIECNCAHLRVLRSFELRRTWFEVAWESLCTFEGIKVVWIEDDLIWRCWVQLCT